MTVIIGSLFLPYTVQFEVDTSDLESIQESIELTYSNDTETLLPSLSKQQTPISPVLRGRDLYQTRSYEPRADTLEGFFYNRRSQTNAKRPHTETNLANSEASTPSYIQPKSRFSKFKLESSIIESKKPTDDSIGVPPGLKFNRALSSNATPTIGTMSATTTPSSSGGGGGGGNLSRNNSTPNLVSLAPTNYAKSTIGKQQQSQGFTLHNNHSAASLISEEGDPQNNTMLPIQVTDEVGNVSTFEKSFNDMVHGRNENRLAPFGGFSKPGLEADLLNEDNIFETAPWTIQPTENGNGSLTKAVNLSVEAGVNGISSTKWVGIIDMPTDDVPSQVKQNIADEMSKEYDCEVVYPDDLTFDGHYRSFCKQILWPTLHYQIPDDAKSKAFEEHSWHHYVLMNQLIANKIVETYNRECGKTPEEENMIWIHDYHLLLVPKLVRQQLPNAKIGLFLHVSFPSSEVFRCFAQRNELLEGMLAANCISFQTDEYVRHFLQTCNRLLLADTNEYGGVNYEGNLTIANTIPIGIDAIGLAEIVESDQVKEWRELIKEKWKNKKLIVCRDKMDKLRGIRHKLLAYEMFLQNNPQYIDSTVLIQICIRGSSHIDSQYESEIMKIVSRINSLPENISTVQPVVLLQRDIDFDQYLALQCEADVFVVSSLREGLNLTCHEYIVATSEKKSPLMLSEFTGSSTLLSCNGNGAILINPWDLKKFSEAFAYSLTMAPKEKAFRWQNCYHFVTTRDSKSWVQNCLNCINDAWKLDSKKRVGSIKTFNQSIFEDFLTQGKNGKKLIFLAVEITPTSIHANKNGFKPTPSSINGKVNISEPVRLVGLLANLVENPDTYVYLVSFCDRNDLDIMFKRYPNVGLIAENGSYIKLIGSKEWISIVDESELKSWMPQVAQLIQSKVERLPGSFCEIQDSTIRFHAGRSFVEDRQRSLDAMGDLIQHINTLYESDEDGVGGSGAGLHATLVRNSVIVQKNQINLEALRYIIEYYKNKNSKNRKKGVSSILYSGGLTTIDEANYEYINHLHTIGEVENTLTITLLMETEMKTEAMYGVRGINEILRIFARSALK
ncbi:TPS3 [[Candida] subhashii]|uniref:TPS3 n=1 Tax=[Candida] subhashii TaxID=561895 RepID=A0A8J5QMP1_9ASCO|nr:TPS3 [[Candida] subhashii]KAG7664828.1 TPS3 [[Candida] subhashii]